MTDRIESLEVRIEEAHAQVQAFARPKTSVTLYLTPGRFIIGFRRSHAATARMEEIGTYTRAIGLGQFRDDVFFTLSLMESA